MVDRDPDTGRWIKGGPAGPGRKPRPVEERYLDLFKSTVSEADWKEIILVTVKQAKKGDAVARKFIADYLIGQPVQRHELGGEGGGAILVQVEYVGDNPD